MTGILKRIVSISLIASIITGLSVESVNAQQVGSLGSSSGTVATGTGKVKWGHTQFLRIGITWLPKASDGKGDKYGLDWNSPDIVDCGTFDLVLDGQQMSGVKKHTGFKGVFEHAGVGGYSHGNGYSSESYYTTKPSPPNPDGADYDIPVHSFLIHTGTAFGNRFPVPITAAKGSKVNNNKVKDCFLPGGDNAGIIFSLIL